LANRVTPDAFLPLQNDRPIPAGDYLCFDYGSKRIGVAIGNSLIGTARPMKVVDNHSGTPDWQSIDQCMEEWTPKALLVGIPLTAEGEKQDMTHHASGFAKRLKKRYNVPVFDADERFSSIEAQQELQKMRARGQRGKTQHADVDKLAAALILERWFSEHL